MNILNLDEITSSDETTTSNVNVFTATNNTLILGPTTSTIPTMYTTNPTTATQSTISTIIKTTNPPAVTTTDPTATTASTTSLMTTLLTNPSIATVTPTTSQTVATSSLTTNPTIRPTVSVNCANKDDFLICGYLTNNKVEFLAKSLNKYFQHYKIFISNRGLVRNLPFNLIVL